MAGLAFALITAISARASPLCRLAPMTFLGALHRVSPSLAKTARCAHTLLIKRGLARSQRQDASVTADGEPVPWITFPARDYLSQLDFSNASVLEYGGGLSSLWWARRAASVITVESDAAWADVVRAKAPENLRLIGPVSLEEYARAPLAEGRTFQVIVVDGKQRKECAEAALPHLDPAGLLVLDNSDWHPGICAWLRERGMLEVDFHGFGPINDYTWTTSVFFRARCAVPHRGQRWDPREHGNLAQEG